MRQSYPSLPVRSVFILVTIIIPSDPFTGMTVGLVLLVTSGDSIRNLISFDYQIFFNLLLPPKMMV